MAELFELVKGISALEAAERQGLRIKSRGSRSWACCPLHGEKTASLCFYAEGTWYCYGCHKGGDAVRLYQEMFSLEPCDAAVRLAGDFGIPLPDKNDAPYQKPKPTAFDLARVLEQRRTEEWSRLCDAVRRADAILARYHVPCDSVWESKEFITALKARSYANMRLDWLWQASLVDLALEYMEAPDVG